MRARSASDSCATLARTDCVRSIAFGSSFIGMDTKTVLIVDDLPANVDVVLGFLSGAGYRVLVSDSGKRALEQLTLALPDIILLDLMMPGMDGIETCKCIKANPEWSHVPVIIMTAADELGKKLAAFRAGAVDFVTKPVQPEEVQARVQTHLQIRELQAKL